MSDATIEIAEFGSSTVVIGDWNEPDDESVQSLLRICEQDPNQTDAHRVDEITQTVLTGCIHGHEQMQGKAGGDETQYALNRCMVRIARAVDMFGGRVIDRSATEIEATFDTADKALLAAIEMQARMGALRPACGVRLTMGIDISQEPADKQSDEPENEGNTPPRQVKVVEPHQITLCSRTRSTISLTIAVEYAEYCQAVSDLEKTTPTSRIEPISLDAAGETAVSSSRASETPQSGSRLLLRNADNIYILDERNPILKIGRDPGSDVVLTYRHSSRHHAEIKYRAGQIVLIDNSTNGTYVSCGSSIKKLLHNQECLLEGAGIICFSNLSRESALAAGARFEVL